MNMSFVRKLAREQQSLEFLSVLGINRKLAGTDKDTDGFHAKAVAIYEAEALKRNIDTSKAFDPYTDEWPQV